MLHYFFLALTPSSYTCTFNTTSFWRDPFKRSHSTSWMYNACPSDVKGKCARDGNPPPRPDLSAFEELLKKCGSLWETARRLSRSRNTEPGPPKITTAVPPHRSLPRPQRHPFSITAPSASWSFWRNAGRWPRPSSTGRTARFNRRQTSGGSQGGKEAMHLLQGAAEGAGPLQLKGGEGGGEPSRLPRLVPKQPAAEVG